MRGEPMPSATRGVSPCMNCTEKYTACHDHCPNYKAWLAEVQKVKDARKHYEEERNMAKAQENRRNMWRKKTF
jgi:hypothetical protein